MYPIGIKSRKIRSKDFLSTWNIYDDKGINVAEGLREIGKVYRTKFILRYLMNNMHPAFWQYINFIGQYHIEYE